MLFCSSEFLLFFVVVFAVYWALPWRSARIWLLLIASFYFYASWNKLLALLITGTTVLDYLLALGMDHSRSHRRRQLLLCISLIVNLGLLCYFKYANFFLLSLDEALIAAGSPTWFRPLRVLLPIGISFYTFEAINYTVDVYRRRLPAERNFAHFLLFILFFPHLVAGPIVRARDFLPQIRRPKRWNWYRLHLGLQFVLMGLFKKLVVADRMAWFVDPVFADPAGYKTGTAWMAVIAYALQVYGDFSGYSDMAIGTAHLLGYKLAQNFDMPFLSANVSEFWRRWHMSLSSWLRDYLFIPLGGSRGGEWKTNRNVFIIMALCGLWHGAAWPFVGWGVVQGLYMVIHRIFHRFCRKHPRLVAVLCSPPGTLLRVAFTFVTFCLSLVVFRAADFSVAGVMFQRLFHPVANGQGPPLPVLGYWLTIGVVVAAHLVQHFGLWQRWNWRLPPSVLGAGYAAVLMVALVLAPNGGKAFIYFQF
ncbi:MAG TPA: MBOAT family O-acyltransferase [Gemmataceae bacterium]